MNKNIYLKVMALVKNKSEYIEENGFLNLFNFTNIKTIGDGNCWYRTLNLYFDGVEDNYKGYGKVIYEQTNNHKEQLSPFFVQNGNNKKDEFLEDLDFDTYIEYISHDYLYAGNIEKILTA